MQVLEIKQCTFAYQDEQLYRDANFVLNLSEHIGLVGQNGSGKSTLIQLCIGNLSPDAGKIEWHPKVKIGYLDQYANVNLEQTLEEFLLGAFMPLFQKKEKLDSLYARIAEGEDSLWNQAGKLQNELEGNDFYSVESQVDKMREGLGLAFLKKERKLAEMSGGQRTKAILAKLLLENPDVFLLDEPTNFLDAEQVDWLANWIKNSDKTFMIVSHDTAFLNEAVNTIVDLNGCKIEKYSGNYDEYLAKKKERERVQNRHAEAQQKMIAKQEAFIQKNIAGNNSKIARGRRKQLQRLERVEAVSPLKRKPHFEFLLASTPENTLIETEHLSVGYQMALIQHLSFTLKSNEKLVLTGFNGAGKTTLIKTLMNEMISLEGSVKIASGAIIGYFAQNFDWKDKAKSPMELMQWEYSRLKKEEIFRKLAGCGITQDLAIQAIDKLSGGEQVKVKLCLLMQKKVNCLILDEPTNHLDPSAKEALKEALIRFEGALILVSHEKSFYTGWINRIIHCERGKEYGNKLEK